MDSKEDALVESREFELQEPIGMIERAGSAQASPELSPPSPLAWK